MICINFSIQFGYYGLWLWFPELFNKLETYYKAHPTDSVSVCQVIDFEFQVVQPDILIFTLIP